MVLDRAKAWIALLGGIVTALLGLEVIPTGTWRTALTVASAIITAILAYQVPNQPAVRYTGREHS